MKYHKIIMKAMFACLLPGMFIALGVKEAQAKKPNILVILIEPI